MDFASAFLGVIAIIGIIIVGGFVIFFLGDLVLSVLDPDYVRFGRKSKEAIKDKGETEKQIEGPKDDTKKIEYTDELEKFKKSNQDLFGIEQGIGDDFFDKKEEVGEENNFEKLKLEEEQFKANMLKAIEERRLEKKNDFGNVDFDKFFFDDEDINVFGEENNLEKVGQESIDFNAIENSDEINTGEDVEDNNIVNVPEILKSEDTNEDVEQYVNEIEKLRVEGEKIHEKNANLEKKLLEAQEEIERLSVEKLTKVSDAPSLELEEYEERLAKLKERLSGNEKELRKVKKDFLPLQRVKKTLERDEKKLRRKEAMVAKQKVILYGVNNIVDIDQDKAKKLTEDLDLLEGLKLSVKHCQEVIEANKDRYPILENTYNILLDSNQILKEDIAEVEGSIGKLKPDNN